MGLTKDGESLAGATAASAQPKCIVTGGAATMTMSYQGRTFPICCTGCRDEFNENPEKYIKKASLLAASPAAKSPTGQSAASSVGRFEDAFANDVVASPTKGTAPSASSKTMTKAKSTTDSNSTESKTATTKSSSTKDDDHTAVAKQASRAASLLKLVKIPPKGPAKQASPGILPASCSTTLRNPGRQDRGRADQGSRSLSVHLMSRSHSYIQPDLRRPNLPVVAGPSRG